MLRRRPGWFSGAHRLHPCEALLRPHCGAAYPLLQGRRIPGTTYPIDCPRRELPLRTSASCRNSGGGPCCLDNGWYPACAIRSDRGPRLYDLAPVIRPEDIRPGSRCLRSAVLSSVRSSCLQHTNLFLAVPEPDEIVLTGSATNILV